MLLILCTECLKSECKNTPAITLKPAILLGCGQSTLTNHSLNNIVFTSNIRRSNGLDMQF